MKSKGFTLIELLVVLAIIGILTSIVMSNMNSAKNSAKDAVIKGSINSASKKAELFYNKHNNYNGLCAEPEFVGNGVVIKAITDNSGTFVCGDGANGFCISSTLNRAGSFCADPIGRVVADVVCNIPNDILCD